MNLYRIFALGTALLLSACAQQPAPDTETHAVTQVQADSDSEYRAIVNVNVLPMVTSANQVIRNQQVLIKRDRIIALGPNLDIPADAMVIDANQAYLIPGLAEMHGHVPPANSFEGIPPRYLNDVLYLYLTGGVTTVRGMLGHSHQLQLKSDIRSGERVGPTLYLAGPSFSGNSVRSTEQALIRVRDQVEEGWDLLKIHPGLTLEEYREITSLARILGIDFAGHVPSSVGLGRALMAGQRTIDHLDGYLEYLNALTTPITDAQLHQAVALTREYGGAVVPTQALWETLIGAADSSELMRYEELQYVPAQVRDRWVGFLSERDNPYLNTTTAEVQAANRDRLLKALHDGGVPVLFGTDAPQLFSVPGFSVRHEMVKMSEAGISNGDILWSATRLVGDYFAKNDRFGSVAVGHRADLVLVAENPLNDLATVAEPLGVMAQGHWHSRAEMDKKLKEISAAYAE
ncbi:MAG: amidohydrolase family protein [Idiomarina sp.]